MLFFPKEMNKRKSQIVRVVALLLALFCLTPLLSRPAAARNTYVITDGDQVTVHTSFESNPEKILNEAGVELNAEDIYTTQVADGVSEITVQRIQIIRINNCGKSMEVSSYGETLQVLLTRLGIPYGDQYQVSHPLETETFDGMEVVVNWVVENRESYTAEIPFETLYCDDPGLASGEEKILVAGVNGEKLCEADVVYVNTQESSRNVITETVITEPVQQIVARGTGEHVGQNSDMPLIGDGFIVLPTGEVLTYTHKDQFKCTAYTSWIADVTGTTATGTKARVGAIAVDPTVVPYGTRMFIITNDGEYVYGIATAEDCGGGVKGKHFDLFFDTAEECFQFGVRKATVYFLGDADWRGEQNKD